MHSTFVYPTILPFKVTSDVVGGRAIKAESLVNGEATCSLATSGSDPIIGVAAYSGVSGETISVQVGGVCFDAIMGSAASLGVFLTAGPDGRLVPAQSGDRAVGVLLSSRDPAESVLENSSVVVMVGLTSVP